MCDCVVNPSAPIVPDLGIFGSADPLAIDKACVDAEINAPGIPILNGNGQWTKPTAPGIEKFNALNEMVNASWQLDAAVKDRIGNIEYKLIKI